MAEMCAFFFDALVVPESCDLSGDRCMFTSIGLRIERSVCWARLGEDNSIS
jgi:hypothetical protein